MKVFLFAFFTLYFSSLSMAQSYRIQNGIGVFGGFTQFNIDTDDFATKQDNGWLVGMAATVDLPHRWYNVSYNIQLSQNQLGVEAFPVNGSQGEFVDYKVFAAQIVLVGHLKLIKNNLTLDAGPMLQYNSDLDLQESSKENFLLPEYNTIRAQDITDITNFNINATVGATLGFDSFKVRAQYIYGFTNILNKLNKGNFADDAEFKGNQSMLVFSAMVVF